MNKDKVMTFRVSPKEYEQIKNRCEKSGYKKTSTYIRKKVLGDSDEMLLSYEKVIQLYDRLSKLEGEFEDIKITVGTSFEAVGEALASGTAQVGFIPGGTYVLYDNDVDVALTATRFGLNHELKIR